MKLVRKAVADRNHLRGLVRENGGGPHYVYILCRPVDGEGLCEPFYVGIGQADRLFSHEEEARDLSRRNPKLEAIRSIWNEGKEIVREIDSVHSVEPWDREEELINGIGLLATGSGPLTNAQSYAPSVKVEGVELRKYAADHANGSLDAIPAKFKLMKTRLMQGPREPSGYLLT